MDAESKQKGIVALTMWLQTFPSFGPEICTREKEKTADPEELFSIIGSPRFTRIVRHIASELCGVKPADENNENRELSQEETIRIWASLFSVTSRMSRPMSDEKVSAASMSASDLKFYILSNLLDISVNHPNLDMRRTYIGRILKLSKHAQKRLMAMVELRVKHQRQTMPQQKAISREATPPKDTQKYSTPPRSSSSRPDRSDRRESTGGTPGSASKTPTKLFREQTTDTTPSNTSRDHSEAFREGSNTGYTPASKRQNVRSPEGGFLSPGTMDSPQAIRTIVQNLQQKNKELSHDLALAQRREHEFKTKMDALKQNHRKDMIRLESASMEREQDLKKELEGQNGLMQQKILALQEQIKRGQKAEEELGKAKDELDVMSRQQNDLAEMGERVRKYKDRVAELHDLKEALKREQEAHSRSVEEIVKLESEVKTLQPAKRQLEAYKIRAIEAEVKLVEAQDYMRRVEYQAQQATETSDSLFKETIMQKEQMDELVKRIQKDTQESMTANGKSVAEGVSELNPEIQQELVRLRNENLQLRAFAAKRQNDQVQNMEARLDDAKRLGAKFQEQFLKTKDALSSTKNDLKASEAREQNLHRRVEELEEEVGDAKNEMSKMQSLYGKLQGSHESIKRAQVILETEKKDLIAEVKTLQEKLKEAFDAATDRLTQLTKVAEDLSQTRAKLEKEQERSNELEQDVDAWRANAVELEEQLQQSQRDLSMSGTKLENARKALEQARDNMEMLNEQMKELEHEKEQLEEQFDIERRRHKESLDNLTEQMDEERQSSKEALEATKAILESKHQQEIMEQSENMNKLLEDERKACRLAREELEYLHTAKASLEQEVGQKLKISQKQLGETIAQMKEENRAEVEAALKAARKESSERHNELVRNGREMINDVKSKCAEEIKQIDEENRRLQSDYEQKCQEFDAYKNDTETELCAIRQSITDLSTENTSLTNQLDENEEKYTTLKRDHQRLQDENEMYRRQVGNRFGGDGKLQAEYDNLQKEYTTLLDENRQLKHQNRHNSHEILGTIDEGDDAYNGTGNMSRSSTIGQIRKEYEETISLLEDEKRELIMRHSAANADKEKAEKRAWEREKENENLNAELISAKLALEKAELLREEQKARFDSLQSPPTNQASFYSAQEFDEEKADNTKVYSPHRGGISGHSPYHTTSQNSPGIDRAKREKAQQERNLRNSISNMRTWSESSAKTFSNQSFSTSPPRPSPLKSSPSRRLAPAVSHLVTSWESQDKNVLSPTQRHDQSLNVSGIGQLGRLEDPEWLQKDGGKTKEPPSQVGFPNDVGESDKGSKPPKEWLSASDTQEPYDGEDLNEKCNQS